MEGAYGLSITLTMIMTSLLLSFYLYTKRVGKIWIGLYLVVYLCIEGSFLIANLEKFPPPQWLCKHLFCRRTVCSYVHLV